MLQIPFASSISHAARSLMPRHWLSSGSSAGCSHSTSTTVEDSPSCPAALPSAPSYIHSLPATALDFALLGLSLAALHCDRSTLASALGSNRGHAQSRNLSCSQGPNKGQAARMRHHGPSHGLPPCSSPAMHALLIRGGFFPRRRSKQRRPPPPLAPGGRRAWAFRRRLG